LTTSTPTWIVAIAEDGNDWQECATSDSLADAIEAAKHIEEHDLVGVFRKRDGWQGYKPGYLIDRRDKSDWPICGLGGLVNSLPSSWF